MASGTSSTTMSNLDRKTALQVALLHTDAIKAAAEAKLQGTRIMAAAVVAAAVLVAWALASGLHAVAAACSAASAPVTLTGMATRQAKAAVMAKIQGGGVILFAQMMWFAVVGGIARFAWLHFRK